MIYKNMKLFRPFADIIIPQQGVNGKHVCLGFFGENIMFPTAYRLLRIKPQYVKHVFVPRIIRPAKSYLTPKYKRLLMGFRLLPKTGLPGEYDVIENRNFFIDFSLHTEVLVRRFKLDKFHTNRAGVLMLPLLNTLGGVNPEEYERTLLYCVSVDDKIAPNIRNRRFFLIYKMLMQWYKDPESIELPFDKILMYVYSAKEGGRYLLLFDKAAKNNSIGRLRTIFKALRAADFEEEMEGEVENKATDAVANNNVLDDSKKKVLTQDTETKTKNYQTKITPTTNIVSTAAPADSPKEQFFSKSVNLADEKKSREKELPDKIVQTVKNYITNRPESVGYEGGGEFKSKISNDDLVATSVFSHTLGDMNRAERVVKALKNKTPEQKKKIVSKHADNVVAKEVVKSVSRNPITQMSRPDELNDGVNPKHILEKRKRDFRENMIDDMVDAFKTLENKNYSLSVSGIKVKQIKSPSSELYPSIDDRYTIELRDKSNKRHVVNIELPHLSEDGTFMSNGLKKIVINQLVTYPIFFFRAYSGKFSSSYSTITIESKKIKRASYLLVHMAGYKFPLFIYMAYRIGFLETLKLFGIDYKILDSKEEGAYKLPDGKYVLFSTTDAAGDELIYSLEYSLKYLPKENFDLLSKDTWMKTLENNIGNRNCTYLLDQVWTNVVTPIEIKLLESRGDPTELDKIVHYMCKEIVHGRVDDRNSLDRNRVRTSEIFVSMIQKQIHAAYNEYEMKLAAGDDTAQFRIDATKTRTQVITSQNVQTLENINPMEEISMMTRITPVGIGGVASKDQYPEDALNIHESYYGNIDPLETPDGPGVGVVQQLSIGAAISSSRGTFMRRDRSKIHPSEILSTGPAMIPFVESNDGNRVLMAAGQIKQAITLQTPENAAVQTGFESVFTPLLSESFIRKCPIENGIIIEVTDLMITIKDKATGKLNFIEITPVILKSGQGKNGLGKFKPVVKVGQTVKKDQIIAEGSNIVDGSISNGINCLAAFMPWKGYNFEDGMVVSETLAKRFVSLHVETHEAYLKEDEDVGKIVKIGEKVKKGDILLTYSPTIEDQETHRHLRSDGGTVVNLEIYSNLEEDKIPESIMPEYLAFKDRFVKIHGEYPIGQFKEKGEKFEGILIKYVLQQELSLVKGDKINNRHFNKGVISIIVPDNQMPVTPWGEKIDILYSPLSVLNRMNTGQILELHTGLISRELSKLMASETRSKFESILNKTLDILDGTDGKKHSRNVMKGMKSLNDTGYKVVREKIVSNRFFPLIFPPFKSPKRERILDAIKLLGLKTKYPVYIPEYNKKTEPVAIGYIYVVKLEHQAEKKIHARGTGSYVDKTRAPVGGKSRGGGAQLGEYDVYSLLGWDCPILIDEFTGAMSTDHVTKNEMISDVVQKGTTEHRKHKSKPVRDLFVNMLLAIHLTSR